MTSDASQTGADHDLPWETTPEWAGATDRLRELYAARDAITGTKPTHDAQRLAATHDIVDQLKAMLKAETDATTGTLPKQARIVFDHMERDELPADGFKAGGRSIHMATTLRAGPANGHDALTAVLKDLSAADERLTGLMPSTVNAQRLASYCREFLDPDPMLHIADADERLRARLTSPNPKPMHPRLAEAIRAYEQTEIRAPKA